MAPASTLSLLKSRLYTKSGLFKVKFYFGHKISFLKSILYVKSRFVKLRPYCIYPGKFNFSFCGTSYALVPVTVAGNALDTVTITWQRTAITANQATQDAFTSVRHGFKIRAMCTEVADPLPETLTVGSQANIAVTQKEACYRIQSPNYPNNYPATFDMTTELDFSASVRAACPRLRFQIEQPTFAIVAAAGVTDCSGATSDRLLITELDANGNMPGQVGEPLCTGATDGNPDTPIRTPSIQTSSPRLE